MNEEQVRLFLRYGANAPTYNPARSQTGGFGFAIYYAYQQLMAGKSLFDRPYAVRTQPLK